MKALALAVPTGRLRDGAERLLRTVGLLPDGLAADRRLLVETSGGARILSVKPADVLTYVEQGAADAGIVGRDMILEQARDVYELLDLGFGGCRAVVALPAARAAGLWQPGRVVRIATQYPRLTARYFEAAGRPVEVVVVSGTVELAPLVGLADGVVDLVVTGRTLRDNHLVEVAEIARSTARLVVNRSSLSRSPRVADLVERVRAHLAEGEPSVRV
ncbi:MAG: ATP phosphoribosyltransferase [Armatimonadetes bacterium]|nr:ATP phosphoribosyltransferase [Armatimonadota bacterium]